MVEPSRETSPKHEKKDVNVSRVAILTLVGLGVLGLGSYLVPYLFFKHLEGESSDTAPPMFQADKIPPEPRLQTTAARDLEDLHFAEEKRLTTYGWVDRPNGVVRIPLERAMDLVADRGLKQRPDVSEEAVVAAGQGQLPPPPPPAKSAGKQQP